MRNTWARAWIASAAVLAAAVVIVRSRTSILLTVEEPVMRWLLDGTDTSVWDRASFFSSTWLITLGTITLAIVGFVLERRVGFAVIITTLFSFVLTQLVRGIVNRTAPQEGFDSSFPSPEVVQTGVFWGLLVMIMWWVGVPKLVWQIVLELAIVIVLVVSIRLIVSGAIWPSDAAGSGIVIALSLITAAGVFEANPPLHVTRRSSESQEVVGAS